MMKHFTAFALAFLVMLTVCELDCFAQRGGRGGGGRGGARGGGFSRGGGGARSRPAPSRPSRSPSLSRPSRAPSRSRPSTPSRTRPSTSRPSRPSRPSTRPSYPTRPSTRPGSGNSVTRPGSRPGSGNPGLRPGSGTRPSNPSLRPGSRPGSGNPGLRPGSGTRPGSPSIRPGSRPGSGSPGLRPGSGIQPGSPGSRPGTGSPGLKPGGGRPGGGKPGTGNPGGGRPGGGKPGTGNPGGGRPGGGKPGAGNPGDGRPGGGKPGTGNPGGGRPGGGKPGAGRPGGGRPPGTRPPGTRPPGRPGYGRPYYPPGYWRGYRPRYRYNRRYYHYYRYGYRPWAWATFGGVAAWIGYSAVTPVVYNYSVSNGYVYNNGEQVAPVEEYEAQATQIAESVPPPDDAAEWMSVGVFAILPQGTEDVDVTVQLAVGKNGAVAGTYYKKEGEITLPIKGAIDEQKQRVAWKVGEEDSIMMETGLDSLTKDRSTVIIYFSEGVSETWDMVRIDQETAKLAQQEIQNDSMKTELVSTYRELERSLNDAWKTYLALPDSVYSATAVPTKAELESVIKHYQQIQVNSAYQVITRKPEFQKTYTLLKEYLKDLEQQSELPIPPANEAQEGNK